MRLVQPGQDSAPRSLTEAQQALRRGAWEEARRRFEAALADGETPEALEGLGAAAWWMEDPATVFASRERAYRLYRDRGDPLAAGRVATELAYDYAVFRAERAVSNGWLQRAHRLLDDVDPAPEQVWLMLRDAELSHHLEGDVERVRRLATQAKELAGRLGLLDLEMLGLAAEGLAMVGMGEVSDAMHRVDEATVAAVAGEMQDFKATAQTLCIMVFACERVRDADRASQWCDRFMEYCGRNGLQAHLAVCRGHYATVLIARGRWDEAEDELTQALAALHVRLAWTRPLLERLGELRRLQGRLDEADDYFARAHPYPPAILGKAQVALDRGDPETALDLVEGVLRRLSERDRLGRVSSLELLVRIRCAQGEVGPAAAALKEIEAVAGIGGADGLLASANHGRGLVALVAGDAAAAKAHLEDALDLYERNGLPFDAAVARLDLGRALQILGRTNGALEQVRRALDGFQSLGAAVEARSARALADELAGTDQSRTSTGILSPREAEVLELLRRGLSNQEIAAELVLSTHTVRRHVSNILDKLDVPSRTAAVAYAV
ncbi:MAG: tetratricopeptide repeat protein [Chloroflexi bacterium]|nr:tetratricopeptide repeat protein [Chloroflexota bacterium]